MDKQGLRLARELVEVINRQSVERVCNTPDFILADAMVEALQVIARAINSRDRWYGIDPHPASDWRGDAELAGYLSGAIPELHQTHPETIHAAIKAFRALPPDVPPEGP